ncbi:13029_t:CDS:2, partial [Racocetra persica]
MIIWEQVESTIHSIGINIFKFNKPKKPKRKWRWISLMGPDKLTILEKFPTMCKINLTDEDIVNFELSAQQW